MNSYFRSAIEEENKELKKQIKRLKRALLNAGFEDHGAELIKPPVNSWGGYWWILKFYVEAGYDFPLNRAAPAFDFNRGKKAAFHIVLNKMDEITKADLLAKKFD